MSWAIQRCEDSQWFMGQLPQVWLFTAVPSERIEYGCEWAAEEDARYLQDIEEIPVEVVEVS